MASVHIEDLILTQLEQRINNIGSDDEAQALLKLIVEIRESARKNNDFDAFDKISSRLAEIGVTIREETHIVPKISTTSHPS
jgi:cysteinyl-tRNA synthetase